MKKLSLIALLLLTACGSDNPKTVVKMPDPPVDIAKPDAYFSAVNTIVADALESTLEPSELDTAAVSMPEDSEPETVKT